MTALRMGVICWILAAVCVLIVLFCANTDYVLWALGSAYLGVVFAGFGSVLLLVALAKWRVKKSREVETTEGIPS